MKLKNTLLGILIIVFAIFGILEVSGAIPPLGRIAGGITYVSLIGGIVLAVLFVDSLCKRRFCTAIFMLAFIFMVFERNIAFLLALNKTNIINNWVLLLFTAIICIGINIMIPRRFIKMKKSKNVETSNFGENLTYIDCSSFTEKHIVNRFGETEIHFENTAEYSGGGTILVENMFGETRIYVPNYWSVSMDVKNVFGASSNDFQPKSDRPKLIIKGSNKFGEVDVIAE